MNAAPDLFGFSDGEAVGIDEGAVTILQCFGDGAEIVEGTCMLCEPSFANTKYSSKVD